MNHFNQFGLSEKILLNLENLNFHTPTSIQFQAIPSILQGKDLLAVAHTGSGKTAAFGIPLVHKIHLNHIDIAPKKARVLILVPTRELAKQIKENLQQIGQSLNQNYICLTGGVDIDFQIEELSHDAHFIIATCGRVLDLIKRQELEVDTIETLVLDEADKMLEMNMLDEIKDIISRLPNNRQSLMFSATMPKTIEDLATNLLKSPEKIFLTPEASFKKSIQQTLCFIQRENKYFLLAKILTETNYKKILVFVRTKNTADEIVTSLAASEVNARAIHSNKSQAYREHTLNMLKQNEIHVLIATDIAARGIHIDDVDLVINFNLPEDANQYVHRIGRTARAGAKGIAISFCDASELSLLKSIEKVTLEKIPVDHSWPFTSSFDELKVNNTNSSSTRGRSRDKRKGKRRR